MNNEIVLEEPLVDEDIDVPTSTESVVTYAKYRSRFRVHFKKLTQKYMRSNMARLVVLCAALFSCVLFVMDAYQALPRDSFGMVSNIVVFVIFLIDVIFNLIYADSKLGYIFSFQGFIDCASLLSIINLAVDSNLVFLPLLRLMRIIKIIRLFRMETLLNVEETQVTSSNDAIYFETISLVIGICLGWFLAAAILFSIIQNSPETFQYVDSTVELNEYVKFFDCLYIILVLVSTLGFGDFAPANGYGRAFVIIVLFCALTIIPQQVSQLIQMIGQQPAYLGEVRCIFLFSHSHSPTTFSLLVFPHAVHF
jgi:voltage-gated potassium channel